MKATNKNLSKQKVADLIRNRILAMELSPGQPLDETSLTEEFGLSRTPLREVIQRLSGEGYLALEENRGAKVASLDLTTLRHFFQAAPMIYASIARLATEQANPMQIDKLKDIQRAYRQTIKEGRSAGTAMENHRFHAAIGEMASSPYLLPSLNRLLIDHTRIGQMFYRSTTSGDARRIAQAADQHDAMIEAIEQRRAAEAVDLTLQHWDLSRGQLEHFVSPDPLPHEFEDMTKDKARAV